MINFSCLTISSRLFFEICVVVGREYMNVQSDRVHSERSWGLRPTNKWTLLFLLEQKSLVNHLWRAFQHTSSNLKSSYSTVTVSCLHLLHRTKINPVTASGCGRGQNYAVSSDTSRLRNYGNSAEYIYWPHKWRGPFFRGGDGVGVGALAPFMKS